MNVGLSHCGSLIIVMLRIRGVSLRSRGVFQCANYQCANVLMKLVN
jgi:hypothetical protein